MKRFKGEQLIRWLITFTSITILLFYPARVYSNNFLIILTDGRKITVDIYGYEGEQIRLHQNGNVWLVKKETVRKIIKLKQPFQAADEKYTGNSNKKARKTHFEIGRAQLTIFEQDYVSTLGLAPRDKELEWLGDVLLQARGDPCDASVLPGDYSIKWTVSPTLSVFKASIAGVGAVGKAVNEINDALAETPVKIMILEPGNESAGIKVIFDLARNFPPSLSTADRSRPDGRCYIRGGNIEDPVIDSAVIWIATDKEFETSLTFLNKEQQMTTTAILQERHWQKIILHELVHALGLFHSAVFKDSIMYCVTAGGHSEENGRIFLSIRDKKAIGFLYNWMPPAERYWFNP
ncbi:MAG: matrixin family metalloprotease [Deltaproteobacteria bacterium]|nr:matrixin family metalloprotease [Deltaproteobacteria bacterium]